ncbi:MAG: hypothetical protein Kow00122_08230 [Thermoleophilia bacterium]
MDDSEDKSYRIGERSSVASSGTETSGDARELALALRRLGLAMADLRAAYAERLGVGATELVALEHLDLEGELSPTELARRLHLTTGALTALADRLTERGHMVRSPHPHDRRSLLLHRTEHAAEELRRHIRPMVVEMMAVTDALTDEERAVVGRFLNEVIGVIERHARSEVPVDDARLRPSAGAERTRRAQ